MNDPCITSPEPATRAEELLCRAWVNAAELADVMLIGIDDAGHICLLNAEARRITGMSGEDLGRPFAETLFGEHAAAAREAWLRARQDGAPVALPPGMAVIAARGHAREIDGRFQPADDPPGLVILSARDVSGERVTQARGRRAERLAAVGTLAAGLAHEIRNPLNGAQLHLTFLSRRLAQVGGADDLLDAAAVVTSEVARLSTLVDDFLEFARPTPVERRRASIDALCRRVLDAERQRAEGVRLALELPESPIVAEVDVDRIEQMLTNLVDNAVDAAGLGGSTVTLAAASRRQDLVIEVRDDGPGVPDAPIFDAFFTTKPSGSGLGLAIVHRIVDDHGGRIELESRPGGTVFRVVLPLSDPERMPVSLPPAAKR